MNMRAPLGLLATTLALGCLGDNDPVTPGMNDSSSGTTGATTMSAPGTETQASTMETGPTTDEPTTTVTTTEAVDTSGSSGPPMGECGDGETTPGEICLDEITVLMSNDTVVSVRIGDVSGSGSADIVYLIPNQIVVRVGDGGGNFGAAVIDESVTGVSFELADFNGDAELDMAVIEDNGPLRVLVGTGSGAFMPSDLDPVGLDPRVLAVGHLGMGNALDVVVGNGQDAMLFTAVGLGDGDLQPPVSFNALGSVHGIALADFTSEGALDVAFTVQGGGLEGVGLRRGDDLGSLFAQRVTPGAMPGAEGIVTGDFDEDDNADLAYVSNTLDMLGVLLGNGDGTFQDEVLYPTGVGPTVLLADDFDGDGREDLVVAHDGESDLRVMVPDSDGVMSEQAQLPLAQPATDLDSGDINDDGIPDIAAALSGQPVITVLFSAP